MPNGSLERNERTPLRVLDGGLAFGLTLITAPAGSGLSSLLARWVFGAVCPAAYLRLAPAHDSLAAFVSAVLVAAGEILRLPPAPGLPPEREEDLTALLINSLATPATDYALVLDRYDLVRDPAIHHAMASLLDYLPVCLHLYLIAPADVPLPIARLRARRQVLELDAARLLSVS